ncbi:MAG: hypothetical protein ACTJG2_04015 [Candidatus Saccharimonadales bacterium]
MTKVKHFEHTKTCPSEQAVREPNSEYFKELGDKRTARHASEEGRHSPDPKEVKLATAAIRKDISPVFTGDTEQAHDNSALIEMKDRYWERAQYVTPEYGAKPGFELEDYFAISPERSYEEIKNRIEQEYTPESIPRSVLDAIDAYHQELGLNPAHATTIVTELLSKGLASIDSKARATAVKEAISPSEAARYAFAEFINTEVPAHIQYIDEHYMSDKRGDEAVKPHMAKKSFYPDFLTDDQNDVAIELQQEDIEGLVRVYDIQSRPYSEQELSLAGDIVEDPAIQAAMIRTQESLVAFSEKYLEAHPERAGGDLRNFSEIFVPLYKEGGEVELAPNPKLLRAMANNVLPGVAANLIETGANIEELNSEMINDGIDKASKDFKLFNANIGQFKNYDATQGTAELHSIYKVVCPANALFPKFLKEHFAQYYEEAKAL